METGLKRRFIYTETPSTPDIYYGKVAGGTIFMPTAAYIKANFSQASGEVGGYPNPKQYSFNLNVGEYVYFVWKDLPSGITYGYRAINLVRNVAGTRLSPMYNATVYKYKQDLPSVTPVPPDAAQQQYYGKIDIDGITYRVFKSGGVYSVNSIVNVYSI